MHIDVVQLHIVIALGVMALAARAADREQRRRNSVSPVPLLVPSQGTHERSRVMQSTTSSRSISIISLIALVLAAGLAIGCTRSPGVPSGTTGADGTVRSQHLRENIAFSISTPLPGENHT